MRSRALRIENAEWSAEIPQPPSRMQITKDAQSVIKPGQNDIRGRVLVASHFPEVNGNSMISQFAPRVKCLFQLCSVDGDPGTIFRRPGWNRLVSRQQATRPLTAVMRKLHGMICVAALQCSGFEQFWNRSGPAVVSIRDDQALRIRF